MIPIAIFASEEDLPWYDLAAADARANGFDPHVIRGIGNGLLSGPRMAQEMVAAMLDISTGGIVAKLDVDTRLTALGAEWLAGATGTHGRRFGQGQAPRCVGFSAHVDRLRKVHAWLDGGRGNACASCTICFGLKMTPVSGGRMSVKRGLVSFRDGMWIPPESLAITLPARELPSQRTRNMDALWNLSLQPVT